MNKNILSSTTLELCTLFTNFHRHHLRGCYMTLTLLNAHRCKHVRGHVKDQTGDKRGSAEGERRGARGTKGAQHKGAIGHADLSRGVLLPRACGISGDAGIHATVGVGGTERRGRQGRKGWRAASRARPRPVIARCLYGRNIFVREGARC